METGIIAEWNIKVGDEFAPGDIFCSIQTDKASVDFETQDEGIVAKLLVDEQGGEIELGTPIMITVFDASDIAAFENHTVEDFPSESDSSKVEKIAEKPTSGSKEVVTPPVPSSKASSTPSPISKSSKDRVFASPLARKVWEYNFSCHC